MRGSRLHYAQLVSRGNLRTYDVVVAVLFGLVFVFVGGWLIYAAISGYGRLKKQAATSLQDPPLNKNFKKYIHPRRIAAV